MRWRRLLDDALIWAASLLMLLCLGFLVTPLLMSIVMSFDARTFLGPFPPTEFSLQWYAKFLGDSFYMEGLVNSLLIGGIATSICVGTGAAAAIGVHRSSFRGKAVVLALFLSPLIIPGVVIGFALLLVLSALGIMDGTLRMIIGHVVITFPYVVRSTLASLVGIGRSLEEASMSLGANEWKVLWTITLPLARTGIVVGALFAFTISIDDVATGIFLADPKSYTLSLALVAMMRANFDLTIAAASVFLLGLALAVLLVVERFIGVDRVVGQGIFQGARRASGGDGET